MENEYEDKLLRVILGEKLAKELDSEFIKWLEKLHKAIISDMKKELKIEIKRKLTTQ